MAELIPMPKLGFDMAEGKLVRKVKKDGEVVKKDDILAEIETDKATVEVPSTANGVVRAWLVEEGAPVPVGANMVIIAAPDEVVDVNALRGGVPSVAIPASAASPTPAPAPAPAVAASATASGNGRAFASPIARRMIDDAGLDIRQIAGTGPGGRITKKDVEAHLRAPKAAQAGAPTPAAAVFAAPAAEDTVVPLTKLRQIIARRMVESKTTIPAFYVSSEIDMAAAMELRRQINAVLPEERKVSVNDLVVKAAALALRQFPNLNALFAGDKMVRKGHVNVGLAVAVEGGLLTVVVKDADVKPLAHIAAEAKALVARARAGKVQGADIEGSTFSVSNLGMYEVENFIAIINPPEAAILAVGAVREMPVIKNGALTTGLRLKATVSADHRVTDGVEAAQFMQAVRRHLEEPLRLLVE